jgi:hypothetical protein
MQVLFSKNGTPYIEVDGTTRMSFSKLTETSRGYKYLVVSAYRTSTVNTSGAKAKKKRTITIDESQNFTVRLVDFKRSDTASFPKGVISPISLKVVKEVIGNHLDDGGYLHRDKLVLVNDELVKSFTDNDEFVNDDPTATESFDNIKTVKTTKTRKPKVVKPLKITAKIKMPTIRA